MTPANLDLTLLNIIPAKTVLRKKHRPDDEALNSQPGDEAAQQWAASDTQSEASAIGGESYQLAQATIPASAASAATVAASAAPVIESTLIANLLVAGAVLGGAAVVADRARSNSTPAPAGDTTAPIITTVAITGASGVQNSTLNAGDVVSITITLSEATTVVTTGGTPQLALNIGGTTVQANYASGSGTTALVFTYTVLAGQTDTNGISIAANSLSLNGGTLKDAAGNAATLSHALVADNAAYLVDTTAPTLAITSNLAAVKAGDTATVSFTFSEAPTGFAASDVNTTGGTLSAPVVSATDPKVYTATFTPTADTAANASITVAAASYSDAAGNSGAAGSTPTVAIDTTLHNIVEGLVTAGPVIPSNGLIVNLYKADGTSLLGSSGLNAAGQFRLDVLSFTGVVIAKVVNTNTAADYMDEATGLAKDLNANLMAVALVTGGVVTLNINPVTTIAAIKAGLTSDGSGSVSATSVGEANTAVAAAFGLGDITTTAPVTTVSLTGSTSSAYFPDDGLNAGERYGAVLASLSGVDKNNGGNTQTTINTLAAAISGTGATATLTSAGQNELVNGATTADANTTGNLTGIFDTRPSVSISALGDTVKSEGSNLLFNQTYSFTITRSHGDGASSVDYVVAGVADAAGRAGTTISDFGLGTSPLMPRGTVSFASGETSKTISVSVAGDNTAELDEKFSVTLQNATNAVIGTGMSVQAIINDDDIPVPTADQIFTAQGVSSTLDHTAGYIRVMADFSKAAYDLQTWESTIAGLRINDHSPLADQAFGAIKTQGWVPVNLGPTLSGIERNYMNAVSVPTADAATLINQMDNGYYTNGNAAAFVARSKDALVISFRGTNDNASQWTPTENPDDPFNRVHPDADQWGAPGDAQNMNAHYAQFAPLFAAIDQFIAENTGRNQSTDITTVYVTGHSLGGAMATRYMNAHRVDANTPADAPDYQSVTFAAPVFTEGALGGQAADARVIQIEIDEDPVPQATYLLNDRPGKVLTFAGNNTGDEPFTNTLGNWNDDNHTMDYYRQITWSVDPDSWQTILALPGDQAIAIGAASGPNFAPLLAGVDRHQNGSSENPYQQGDKFDTAFIVDGRITDTDTPDGKGLFNELVTNINYPIISNLVTNSNYSVNTLTSGRVLGTDPYTVYYGGQGNDFLSGGGANELFLGGPGNDTIRGGGGADTLDGGTGADNFIYSKYASPVVTFDASSGKYSFDGGTAEVITKGSFDVSGLQGDRITFAAPTMSGDQPFSPMPTPSNGQVGDDQYFLERGTFNTVNGSAAFTRNGSGADTLVVYDSNDALSTAVGNGAFVIQGVIPGNLSTTKLTTGESVIYYAPDTTAPTLTITAATSGTATGPVVYGFNFSEPVTGFTADDVVTTGVKAQLIQTDATHYTMTVIPPTGSGTMQVGVNAGAVTDLAGNPNTLAISDPQAYAPAPVVGPYTLGQNVIPLGIYGTLIAPVQVEGKWYYYWDRSGDQTSANSGIFNGGLDYTTHIVLDGLFNHDINGVVVNTTVTNYDGAYGTTDSYRYATLNGVSLALPTRNGGLSVPPGFNGYQSGTAISLNAVADNPVFDDLLAVWDAYNGTATALYANGAPKDWQANVYLSATPSGFGHALIALNDGGVNADYDTAYGYVALQVLAPDTTAPTFTSAATATLAENTHTSTTAYAAATASDFGVSYTLTGVDAALFNITAATGLVTFKASPNFEAPADAGANNVFDFTVTATDASSNATGKAVQLSVTDVAEGTYTPGQATIPLGNYGNLIAPVQVEGNWYYFWDRSGDLTSAYTGIPSGSLNGGWDYTTHNVLDGIFKYDINGTPNTTLVNADGAYGTTDTYRYGTLSGVSLALPTAGGQSSPPYGLSGIDNYQPGTAVSSGATNNATYNDLLAVWDASNLNVNWSGVDGTPTGWFSHLYWSATPSASGHAYVGLKDGFVGDGNEGWGLYAAVQVLSPDTTAPTFTSAATATLAENTPTSTTVYDATADGDVGVSYTLTGADAALFNIAPATGLVTFKASPNFEAPTDAGANNVYDFTVTATDASSNATAKAVQLTVTDVAESTSLAGQAVIGLGTYGKLIAPVQVEGKWYYFWDRSGDGTSADTGSLNGGVDYTNHNVLDLTFKYASDFTTINPTYAVGNAAADDTTDTYRFATINGVNVALPTVNGGIAYWINANQNGTSYTDAGLSTNGTTSSYNDLLAVWDAYNGGSTGTYINGTPTGWQANIYWSATPSAAGHATVTLNVGSVNDRYDFGDTYVALQVL